MAELINLRRAKKAKARADRAAEADANRTKHGIAKPVRDLAKARTEKDLRDVDARKLDEKE
ncbi:MAG TPA: DUF4169 family protein [Rhizomicrobium sp.]|jgi:hypothetical protein|nr:DUF4169 family protein [Rhizomicrobium sp.]